MPIFLLDNYLRIAWQTCRYKDVEKEDRRTASRMQLVVRILEIVMEERDAEPLSELNNVDDWTPSTSPGNYLGGATE